MNGKKLTTEEFIQRAKKIHGDNFDYSLVDYKKAKIKIKIICKIHGIFEQLPNGHLSGTINCPKCFKAKIKINNSLTQEEYLNKAKSIHGVLYDYSLVNYKNAFDYIDIICKKHGIFKQIAYIHTSKKCGCPKCAIESRMFNSEEFIKKANDTHNNKYNYNNLNYNGVKNEIVVECPIHGSFKQSANSHLNGRGCKECKKESLRQYHTKTIEKFIKQANEIHKGKYDYSNTIYKSSNHKIIINCKLHGPFKQFPYNHLSGNGCLKCNSSWGELKILNFLLENNINFVKEKSFSGCKYKNKLRFDFYLQNLNILIEYDGEHHYKEVYYNDYKTNLTNIQYKDSIKNKFCEDNNIKLIRIPYWDFKNIEEILKKELNL